MYNTNASQQKWDGTHVARRRFARTTIYLSGSSTFFFLIRTSDFQSVHRNVSKCRYGNGEHSASSQIRLTYPMSSANGSWKRSPTVETEARDSSSDFAAYVIVSSNTKQQHNGKHTDLTLSDDTFSTAAPSSSIWYALPPPINPFPVASRPVSVF